MNDIWEYEKHYYQEGQSFEINDEDYSILKIQHHSRAGHRAMYECRLKGRITGGWYKYYFHQDDITRLIDGVKPIKNLKKIEKK